MELLQDRAQDRAVEFYVNGDSVSVGYGLDPAMREDIGRVSTIIEYDRYGAIVSRHFRLKENNDAKLASSNDSIVRRTTNSLASSPISLRRFAIIGLTSPFRSELRYDGKYIRMFFGRDSEEGFNNINKFFFGRDVSDNEFRIRDYLGLCNLLSMHSYDDEFLAERLLQQIILLQSFFKALSISFLFMPVYGVGVPSSAFRSHKRLIDAVDSRHFLRLDDALNGWSLVGECKRRGYKMYEDHPLQDGHTYIAEQVIHMIENCGLT
jgi:hypothetical protein